jgi:hypothetical protein
MISGFELNSRTLVALLLACEGVLELRLVKEIRGYCLRNGYFDASSRGYCFGWILFEF